MKVSFFLDDVIRGYANAPLPESKEHRSVIQMVLLGNADRMIIMNSSNHL